VEQSERSMLLKPTHTECFILVPTICTNLMRSSVTDRSVLTRFFNGPISMTDTGSSAVSIDLDAVVILPSILSGSTKSALLHDTKFLKF
jgi:hypothetical protein